MLYDRHVDSKSWVELVSFIEKNTILHEDLLPPCTMPVCIPT